MKKVVFVLAGLAVVYFIFTFIAPPIIEKNKNKTLELPPYSVDPSATIVYNQLPFVADLHSDALLWDRNLNVRKDYGHVDIPRLLQAHAALQVFSIVTKTPRDQNYDSNTGETDNITLLNFAQGKTPGELLHLSKRAWDQAERLDKYAQKSKGRFRIIRTREEFRSYIIDMDHNRDQTAGILSVEGAHMLEGDLENLDTAFQKGIRIMAPVHFFDNLLGGSAHGVTKGGITDFGRKWLAKMDSLDMIVDLSHASAKLVSDILEITDSPVIVTHTGARGVCNRDRNLSDDHIRKITEAGGLIGVAMFEEAICGSDAASVAKTIKYVADIGGVEHVALGSDFDGAVTVPFDVTGLPLLIPALENEGFTRVEIARIMGMNVRDFFLNNLPE